MSEEPSLETVALTNSESTSFNPLALKDAPGGGDALVSLLGRMVGVSIEGTTKEALRTLILRLPDSATMKTLVDEIKTREAASIGMTVEQYETFPFEALRPLIDALNHLNMEHPQYAALVIQPKSSLVL